MAEPTKKDWKLFCERIGQWQENWMEHLEKEYIALLQSDDAPSVKFWNLDKRLKEDKRSLGVQILLEKKEMLSDLIIMLREGIITEADLEGFSEPVQEYVLSLYRR